MSSSTALAQYRLASSDQIRYARELGLPVEEGQPAWEVGRAIRTEVRRRGREVLQELRPSVGQHFEHPRHGLVRLVRIGQSTLKATLQIASTGRKIVVDMMRLGEYS